MIILFSHGCPKCNVLEKKLKEKNINFIKEETLEEVIDKGFLTAPILKVNGRYMEFGEAIKWVNSQ